MPTDVFRTEVHKRPGRPVRLIRGDFFLTPPSEAQAAIVALKNNGGKPRSWQAVANELGDEVGQTFSGALMYRIAKGEIESEKVEQALGIKPRTVTAVCPNPKCNGEDHSFDCREQVVKPKPRKRQPRPSVPYFKCRQDDIEQVRRQVEKYLPGYELKRKGE